MTEEQFNKIKEYGLLETVPEERQQYVATIIQATLDYLEYLQHATDHDDETSVMLVPLMIKIGKSCDHISRRTIVSIHRKFFQSIKKVEERFPWDQLYGDPRIDIEAEFVAAFAEEFIKLWNDFAWR